MFANEQNNGIVVPVVIATIVYTTLELKREMNESKKGRGIRLNLSWSHAGVKRVSIPVLLDH